MSAARRPFPSRPAAIESVERLFALAEHGIARLESKYRIDAPSVRKQLAETKRGIKQLVRAHDWRART